MPNPEKDIFRSLAKRDLLLPYFKMNMLADDWPDHYNIKIDSRPYYGSGDGYFHPSTHGFLGERRLYYQFHPAHRDRLVFEKRDVQSEMTLAMGSALHGVLQTQFQMSGLLESEDDIEVEFIIDAHHVRGRTDMIVEHPTEGRMPVEIKTLNSRGFDLEREMKEFWQLQLSMALHGLRFTQGVLLVLESGYPYRMKEYRHSLDEEQRTKLNLVFAKFHRVMDAVAASEPPAYCCVKGSKDMDKCPARFECHLKSEVKRD